MFIPLGFLRPLHAKRSYSFSPDSGVSGQVGQNPCLLPGNAHETLFVYTEKKHRYTWLCIFPYPLSILQATCFFISFIICSNVSIVFHLFPGVQRLFPSLTIPHPYFADEHDFSVLSRTVRTVPQEPCRYYHRGIIQKNFSFSVKVYIQEILSNDFP